MGTWQTQQMKAFNPAAAAKELARVLIGTQKKRVSNQLPDVAWSIAGDGAKLLKLALGSCPGFLDKHTFKFIDPSIDVSNLLISLEQKGAKFDKEPIKITGKNTAANVAIAKSLQNDNLSRTLKSIDRNLSAGTKQILNSHGRNSAQINLSQQLLKNKGSGTTFMDIVNQAQGAAGW
ncbi:hypothetical protein GCM10007877_18990 [Marinibactrum halimedae]|uniref:Uncharacterized protein n=2 Tax=Marinibactrum halimedae TaxID=1444977 RepID=A0AA37T5W7_9GAMM|nr:hypothetical protein GCM10007877_18990 [Marinibactrum halimedae]